MVGLTEMPELRAMKLMRNPTATRDAVYKIISRYPFQFPTGTMQAYSNSGFWLLGLIIENASGMTYEEYVEKRIFEPLGMTRSMYCNNSESVARRAYGYGLRNGITRRAPEIVHTGTYAAGALCSTAEDMITWLQALHGGRVLRPRSYAEMIKPARLKDGTALRYSMGLTVGEDSRGLRYIGHNGGGFGFSSEARWYPDAQLAVVVLTNSEPDTITVVTEDLAAAVVPAPRPAGPLTGDADAAGDRVLLRRRGGGSAAVDRELDVPPKQLASDLPPECEGWSGYGTAVRHGRRPLHPETAVEASMELQIRGVSKTPTACRR
jgi:CubicO group peptidase (beta-lactamase class C family)